MVKNIPYGKVAEQAKQDIDMYRKIKNSLRQNSQDGQRTVVLDIVDRDYYGDQVRNVFTKFNTVCKYKDVDEKMFTEVEYMSHGHNEIWHVSTTTRKTFDDDEHIDIIHGDAKLLIAVIEKIVNDVLVPAREECLQVS